MAQLPETSTWREGVTQIETSELVLGGSGGVSNRALLELADRTRWLYNRINALSALPLSALPYPTIGTEANRLAVTPVSSGIAGGKVTAAAGQSISVGELVTENLTGRLLSLLTPDFTSPEMAISSTYYLRGRVNSGVLQLYVQGGTDADTTPAGLVGTPNATSGGGFDSTKLDVLIAKIVTGTAGSTPSVTTLANSARLSHYEYRTGTPSVYHPTLSALQWEQTVTLNWGRAPAIKNVTGTCYTGTSGKVADGWQARARVTAASRYSLTCWVASDWETDMSASDKNAEMTINAFA